MSRFSVWLLWLIIAEHALQNYAFHNTASYPKWSNSGMRTYLKNTASGGWLTGKGTLQGAAQAKTLYTRIQHYASGANNYTSAPNLYETTEDKLFLLSLEETFYTGTDNTVILGSATTDVATIRTNGSKVLFADRNARRVNAIPSSTYGYWLRTPYADTVDYWVTLVNLDGTIKNDNGGTSGGNANGYTCSVFSTRPAAWVVQQVAIPPKQGRLVRFPNNLTSILQLSSKKGAKRCLLICSAWTLIPPRYNWWPRPWCC